METKNEKFWKKRAVSSERTVMGQMKIIEGMKEQIRLLTAQRDILAGKLRGLQGRGE